MRQTVDGFTPRRRSMQKTDAPVAKTVVIKKPGHAYSRSRVTTRSIDGMRRVTPPRIVQTVWEERPRVAFDRPEFIRDPVIENKPVTRASMFRKALALLQYPLSAILLSVAVYSTAIGRWFILLYAIYALIRGVQSKSTFVAALLLLVAIPLFQVINQPGVADNIAVYAYELLIVGTVQVIVELVKNSKRKQTVV